MRPSASTTRAKLASEVAPRHSHSPTAYWRISLLTNAAIATCGARRSQRSSSANRTPVPEVGGDYCDYIDPENTSALHDALNRALWSPNYVKIKSSKISRALLRTWQELIKGIISHASAVLSGSEII